MPPLTGEPWCFAHHPDSAGGRNAHRYIDFEAEPDLDAMYEDMLREFIAELSLVQESVQEAALIDFLRTSDAP